MATISDITTIPLSGQNHIDALLDSGPDWNYMLPAGNTIKYTFSITSGNEDGKTGQQAFTSSQQDAARKAFAYLASLTGIQFVETAAGTDAQIHLANIDIADPTTTGLCSWHAPYSYDPNTKTIVSFDPQAYVYLDNNEFFNQNQNLSPGGYGYETLLHELGHAMGLKHPFDTANNPNTLPASQDNTSNTLMSYTDLDGPYSTYQQDDIAALNWLYGKDGLGGALGINSTGGGRYVTGTSAADYLVGGSGNDMLEGDGGNDVLNGGTGTDTAVFRGPRKNYTFTLQSNGDLLVHDKTALDGNDTLKSIEFLKFTDTTASAQDVLVVDVTPPAAPTLVVTRNANGYALGNSPIVTGGAEANSTVTLYDASHNTLGTTTADAHGLWSYTLGPLEDGDNYSVSATATDAAGNVSTSSAVINFKIDTVAPTVPTFTLGFNAGDNHATLGGLGEAGTAIMIVRTSDLADIASTTVGDDGHWSLTTSPLPNGDYTLAAVSVDGNDNSTSATNQVSFTVANAQNMVGSVGDDKLIPGAANIAIDGGDGLDTVIVAGPRANYTVAKQALGYGLVDNVGTGGYDSLINVERVQFSDAMVALDVDGVAGKAYRLYQAAFDRVPDLPGLGFWISAMDHGTTELEASGYFIDQSEFRTLYGPNPSDNDFLTRLYSNVLHRAPDSSGLAFWLDAMEHKGVSRAEVLAQFSESPENQAQVIGSIQNGIAYQPWHG